MFKKGSKFYSIVTGACPKCHSQSMYTFRNPYKIGGLFKMNDHCSSCHTKYKMEPSFFYGAMYVSYAVGVAIAIAVFIISFVILNASLPVTFIAIVSTLVLMLPLIIRLSRNIWINFFVSYHPEAALNQTG